MALDQGNGARDVDFGEVKPVARALIQRTAVGHAQAGPAAGVGGVGDGFGGGLTAPSMSSGVARGDPGERAGLRWKLADVRRRGTNVSVQRAGLDAQLLPFADDSFDAALSTWTLCTIPDVAAALSELRRVLKPGGTFHFLEHGLAPDEQVRRWQRRLDPLQKRIAGGCHLTRPVIDLLRAAGFAITEVDGFYEVGTSKIAGADSLGSALSP